ncbi:MAG: hypothetical protein KKC68_02670 [Candidatus Thermoplasmatota archaeon]|nr:hypothetical protein [Candidatus Thermoplasmatota archaeon]MBU1940656.1 hypothetical protein [Candidatus Thermoplasmatota archaeon]
MPPKKRKRVTRSQDEYDAEKLAELGIYKDDKDESKDLDEKESWRDYI